MSYRDPFLRFYPKALPDELCDRIVAMFDADPRKHAGLVGEEEHPQVVTDLKDTLDLDLTGFAFGGDEGWMKVQCELTEILEPAILQYGDEVESIKQIEKDFGLTNYQIQRYEPNVGKFGIHIDRSCPNSAHRELGLVIYLNDVDEGGETAFPYQATQVKPEKGGLAIFPAGFTHPHQGLVPVSGPKYIISSFVCYLGETIRRTIPRSVFHRAPEDQA